MDCGKGSSQELFLRGVAAIFLIAFTSIWVQLPGLISRDGLVPASGADNLAGASSWTAALQAFIRRPSLLQLLPALPHDKQGGLMMSIDIALETCMLAGGVIAAWTMCCRRGGARPAAFAALFVLYLTVVRAGGPFLSFQWDTLLLETGMLAALYAPGSYPPARLLLRFLFFKLMLMAGIVKLQSNCPTWSALTATQYHYATQCLPTALAWWAHQLPPLLHKATVAVTLVIEIPAAFLLIAPLAPVRRVGVVLQLLLQVSIALTGNYTFFNLLTALLCVPAWERDSYTITDEDQRQVEVHHTGWRHRRRLEHLFAFGAAAALATCTIFMFEVSNTSPDSSAQQQQQQPWWQRSELRLAHTSAQYDAVVARVLPTTMCAVFLWLLVSTVVEVVRAKGATAKLTAAIRGAMAHTLFALSTFQFQTISRAPAALYRHPLLQSLHRRLSPWNLTSSYGLFRSMTGVGSGGVVARPEVVISGSMDGQEWTEIDLKFKPGGVGIAPLQVAPYQPRLDWQMWFAALGSYGHHPWVLSLVHKLHHGCGSAIALLDESKYPFKGAPPAYIKADLYQYDFTRVNTSWAAATLHSPPQQATLCSNGGDASDGRGDGGADAGCVPRGHWWYRRHVKQYFPPLEKDNASLLQFLQHNGLPSSGCVPLATDTCGELQVEFGAVFRGKQEWTTVAAAAICNAAAAVRNEGIYGWCTVMGICMVLARLCAMMLRGKGRVSSGAGKAKTE